MDRIQWNEETITFRSLVDNANIPKPALGRQRVCVRDGALRPCCFSANRNETDLRRRETQGRIHHGIAL